MDQAKLINIYLSQTEHYHSDSKGMIKVSEMHCQHAANAARKLLNEAADWSADAGRRSSVRAKDATGNATVWMLGTPLWNALWRQSQS